MADPGFNKPIRNINERKDNLSGEQLIEKLGLKKGTEVSLIKRSLSDNSTIGVGGTLGGKLTNDAHIGECIYLDKGNTSPIKEINEDQGRYFVKTFTSVYELFLKAKQEGNFKKAPGLENSLNYIESHLVSQPQSIRTMFQEMKDKFYTQTQIGDKNFLFTKINSDDVMALVEDQKNPGKYKTRIFRFSGSDHQWKSLPGERADGSYMKGDEINPMHHYVQSAKLHKDVYKFINDLPQGFNHYSSLKYLPTAGKNGDKGKYWEEFEFKEKYQTLKNKEWASFQNFCQKFYKGYDRFVLSSKGFKDFTLEGGLYQWVSQLESIQEFKNIKNYLEQLNKKPEYSELLKNCNLTFFYLSNENPELKKMSDVYDENVSSYVEKCFKARFPETMMPNFSENNCIDKYTKKDIDSGKENNIYIEEYTVSSPEGDKLVFSMARDDKGRVYIDNIYDPRVGISTYGTPEEIVQMGHLVYKPEDYPQQASFGFPKKYQGELRSYVDISALWGNIPIISKYKEELQRRGVLS